MSFIFLFMEALVFPCGKSRMVEIYIAEPIFFIYFHRSVCVLYARGRGMLIHTWICVGRTEINAECLPQSLFILSFIHGLLLNLDLVILARLARETPPCPPVSAYPVLGYSWWRAGILTLVHTLVNQALCPPTHLPGLLLL